MTTLNATSEARADKDPVCYYCDGDGPVVHSHWLGDGGSLVECFIHPRCAIERGRTYERSRPVSVSLSEMIERLDSMAAVQMLNAGRVDGIAEAGIMSRDADRASAAVRPDGA